MPDITDDLKALREYCDSQERAGNLMIFHNRIRRVVDECERLQKDAARYRWMKKSEQETADLLGEIDQLFWDDIIDAAMQEQPR